MKRFTYRTTASNHADKEGISSLARTLTSSHGSKPSFTVTNITKLAANAKQSREDEITRIRNVIGATTLIMLAEEHPNYKGDIASQIRIWHVAAAMRDHMARLVDKHILTELSSMDIKGKSTPYEMSTALHDAHSIDTFGSHGADLHILLREQLITVPFKVKVVKQTHAAGPVG